MKMMELQKVMEMTNESGREWLSWGKEVIGIEDRNEKNWFYAVFRYTGSEKVYVLSLPRKRTDCKASNFGHLYYFALLNAQKDAGIGIVWNKNGWPMWPVWHCNDEQKLRKFEECFASIIGKYGFDKLSIDKNYHS